jgi:hypothetical protein
VCLLPCSRERDIRVIPLRYPSSRKLGEGGVGRARVWRHRRNGRCGYRHVVVVEREYAMAGEGGCDRKIRGLERELVEEERRPGISIHRSQRLYERSASSNGRVVLVSVMVGIGQDPGTLCEAVHLRSSQSSDAHVRRANVFLSAGLHHCDHIATTNS